MVKSALFYDFIKITYPHDFPCIAFAADVNRDACLKLGAAAGADKMIIEDLGALDISSFRLNRVRAPRFEQQKGPVVSQGLFADLPTVIL